MRSLQTTMMVTLSALLLCPLAVAQPQAPSQAAEERRQQDERQAQEAERAVAGDQHEQGGTPPATRQVKGRVLGQSGLALSIEGEKAMVPMQLVVKDLTDVTVTENGETSTFESLQPGDEVRVSYTVEGDVRVLLEVEVLRSGATSGGEVRP